MIKQSYCQFHNSSTQGQEGQGQSSETGDKPAGGGERRRRRKPVLKELSGYDMEEGAGKVEYPLSQYNKPSYILVQGYHIKRPKPEFMEFPCNCLLKATTCLRANFRYVALFRLCEFIMCM